MVAGCSHRREKAELTRVFKRLPREGNDLRERRRTLERSGDSRRQWRSVGGVSKPDRAQRKGREEADEEDRQNCGQGADARTRRHQTWPVAGRPGVEMRRGRTRGSRVALALDQELENGIGAGLSVLEAGLSAAERGKSDGGNCHPDPRSSVWGSPHHGIHLIFCHS